MTTQWCQIQGYEGLYEVSNAGQVKSVQRTTTKGGILKSKPSEYPRVDLCKNGKVKSEHIHRLVAIAFVANPENLPWIIHKDGDKWNNNATNLEWCTPSHNQRHRYTVLNHKTPNRSLTPEAVMVIRAAKKTRGYRIELAKQFNTTVDVIEKVRGGHNYKAELSKSNNPGE